MKYIENSLGHHELAKKLLEIVENNHFPQADIFGYGGFVHFKLNQNLYIGFARFLLSDGVRPDNFRRYFGFITVDINNKKEYSPNPMDIVNLPECFLKECLYYMYLEYEE